MVEVNVAKRPKFHEVSGIFPPMGETELAALAEDIQRNGLRVPIVLHPDGSILDGRNRWLACEKAQVEPKTTTWRGRAGTEVAYVRSLNLERRHLTQSQAAVSAIKAEGLPEQYRIEAKERQKSGKSADGKAGGRGRKKTLSNSLDKVFRDHSGEADAKLGADYHTNREYVRIAREIATEAPELLEQVETGDLTIPQAKRQLKEAAQERERKANRRKVEKAKATGAEVRGVFSTIVLDPPWDYREEGDVNVYGRTKPTYELMSIDQIEKLPVARVAADNAHLYLWITNRSLPKGFRLLEVWGFRFVTVVTWCKPSIGVGNYFRNNTEHILFGVKGTLSLSRKDVGTWFEAKRGPKGHSSKPPESYDLIESCSPGPYVEFFARSRRPNWTAWGAEVS